MTWDWFQRPCKWTQFDSFVWSGHLWPSIYVSNWPPARRQTAPTTETNKVNNNTSVQTRGSICTAPKILTVDFENKHSHVICSLFVYCPRRACFYAVADWLNSFVIQRVARGQLPILFLFCFICSESICFDRCPTTSPHGLTFSWWVCYGLCQRHKLIKFAHFFLYFFILFLCLFLSLWPFQLYLIP